MKNFVLLKSGIVVARALIELYDQGMWNWLNLRRGFAHSCHKEIEDVVMRFAPLDRPQNFESIMNGLDTVSYIPWFSHLHCQQLLRDAFPEDTVIGRVVASKVPPGAQVYAHKDEGAYARSHHRFHIVLSSESGNEFHCGGEIVEMEPGELWLFNHQETHSVINKSKSDRVHLIVDVRM